MDSYRDIEKLIYTYAEFIDAGNLQAVAKLFTHAKLFGPEGNLVASGAEETFTMQSNAIRIYPKTGTPLTKHVISNLIIDIDEANHSATSRAYFTVFQATDELPLQAIINGRYKDSFERVNHCWRFKQRQTIPDQLGDLSKHLLYELKIQQ